MKLYRYNYVYIYIIIKNKEFQKQIFLALTYVREQFGLRRERFDCEIVKQFLSNVYLLTFVKSLLNTDRAGAIDLRNESRFTVGSYKT